MNELKWDSFWSWLTVLARSALIDEARKQKRYFAFLERFFANERSPRDEGHRDPAGELVEVLESQRTTGRILALILLASLALLSLDRKPRWARPEPQPARNTISIISSQPLGGEMVGTHPGSIHIVTSRSGGFSVFGSKSPEELFAELDDARLLDLLADQGAIGLVRYESNNAKLLGWFLSRREPQPPPIRKNPPASGFLRSLDLMESWSFCLTTIETVVAKLSR